MRASSLLRVSVVGASLAAAMALGSAGPLAAQQAASPDSVRAVAAVGVGPTSEAATQAALRSAVEQGVGVFVTSQTRVENDRLIQDRILSLSTGFVRRFQVIETRQGPSGVEVRVLVEVGLTPLREALQAAGVQVQLSGHTLFSSMAQEDEKRRQEVNVLAALFWEDVDLRSSWDFQVAAGTPSPSPRRGFYTIPLTVKARPNGNAQTVLSGVRQALWSIAGASNRVSGPLRAVNVTTPVIGLFNDWNYPRRSWNRPSGAPCGGRTIESNFRCAIPPIAGELGGNTTSRVLFPGASYFGGWFVSFPNAHVLLRTKASSDIVGNFLNQAVFSLSYSIVVERDGGGPARVEENLELNQCRAREGPAQDGIFFFRRVSRDPEVWQQTHYLDPPSWRSGLRHWMGEYGRNYSHLPTPMDFGLDIAAPFRWITVPDSLEGSGGWRDMENLRLAVPEEVMRRVTSIRIEPSGVRLVRGLRVARGERGNEELIDEHFDACTVGGAPWW